jgi:hypothetical protein
MGGDRLDTKKQAKQAAGRVFDKYPRLAEHKNQRAGLLSGGPWPGPSERRRGRQAVSGRLICVG